MYPNLRREKNLWKKGFNRVACLDEAGRGPLAGPVVAAVVVLKPIRSKSKKKELKFLFKTVKDSKKLTKKKRKKLYEILIKNHQIKWGRARVSEKVVDRINILEATKLAMKRAIKKLKMKPDFLILDGSFKIPSKTHQKSIKGADEKVFSCSCASIIAKVYRDKIMQRLHKKYPLYGFDKHKGYPTKHHLRMLKKYGPCKIHRKSFRPVAKLTC
jgi:ribonuclease HII